MREGPEMETRGKEMRPRCKKSSKCQWQLIITQIQYNIECKIQEKKQGGGGIQIACGGNGSLLVSNNRNEE